MPEYSLSPDDIAQIRRQTALFRDFIRQFAEWGEIVGGLPGRLDMSEGALRDGFEELSEAIEKLTDRITRLEQITIADKIGGDSRQQKNEIRHEHDTEHLRRMLQQTAKNLQRARERAAKYGVDVPVSLQNEIDEYEAAKERIEADLRN